MKKTFSYIFAGILLAGASLSCSKNLNIEQHGSLNYETYYKTDDEAETATAYTMLTIRNMESDIFLTKNMLSDDFWAGGAQRNDAAALEKLNEFTFDSEHSNIKSLFSSYYSVIYYANVAIHHVEPDTPVKKRVVAENRVLRAWAHFELASLWGNPPIVDHELEASEYAQPNSTDEALWSFLETELSEAIASGALAQKSGVNDQDTWQPTKQFAQAILGKVYLWQGKKAQAAQVLDEVINSGLYALYDGEYEDLQRYDNALNCEEMFTILRVDDPAAVWVNINTYRIGIHWKTDAMNLSGEFSSMGWGQCNPQKSLYDAFVQAEGENGYRLGQSIKTVDQMAAIGNTIKDGMTLYGNEGFFMWKWRRLAGEAPGAGMGYADTNSPRYMRFAEVLLLAAEANLGVDQAKADEYFNMIRTRAKAATKSNVTLADIQLEKRCELCGEGTRFQDMLRWGIAAECLKNQGGEIPTLDSNGNVSYQQYNKDASKYGFKDGKHNLLPYPALETSQNTNIKQNPQW